MWNRFLLHLLECTYIKSWQFINYYYYYNLLQVERGSQEELKNQKRQGLIYQVSIYTKEKKTNKQK